MHWYFYYASQFSWWHWDSAATDIIYNLPNSKLPNPGEPFITKMRYEGRPQRSQQILSGNGEQFGVAVELGSSEPPKPVIRSRKSIISAIF